ncbi:MAG: hypothetical protein CMC40_04395 [Flavobacteriaceae bacterium]|nr:hypothetical protein [Flavobacteriaceae bacterium]
MIKFLLKGILRDKSKSLIPVCVISLGVFITVFMSGFVDGVLSEMISSNANLDTGHLKVMTKPYNENKDQLPNDLALLEIDLLIESLESEYPNLEWVPRIKFGGILDVPDVNGETIIQGPGIGLGLSILGEDKGEIERLSIKKSIVRGSMPENPNEILLSEVFSKKLKINPGDEVTFFGSTMEGSMVFESFVMSGTVMFGNPVLDRSTFIVDFKKTQMILDMENGSSELLAYFKTDFYDDKTALKIESNFNKKYLKSEDEFAPIILSLRNQNDLGATLDLVDSFSFIFISIFVIAMSLVLWNTGLIGGLRRYQEFGIRLALGESKKHVYSLLIIESIIIGFIGSTFGTGLGFILCYYMQETGIDISEALTNSVVIIPSVLKAKVSSNLLYLGYIPGLISIVFGTALAGRGIFKRNTSKLFKELEV